MPIKMKISLERLQKDTKRKRMDTTQEAKRKKLEDSSLLMSSISTPVLGSSRSPVLMEVPVSILLMTN